MKSMFEQNKNIDNFEPNHFEIDEMNHVSSFSSTLKLRTTRGVRSLHSALKEKRTSMEI